jgi:hypothetical protein
MKKIVSTNIDTVRCVIGQRTRQPNAITMVLDPKNVIEAVELYESRKKGIKPSVGLIGYELVAVYIDEPEIDPDKDKHRELDLEIVDNLLFDKIRCLKCDRKVSGEECPLQCVTNTQNIEDKDLFEEVG